MCVIDNSAAQDKCFEDILRDFQKFHSSYTSAGQISDTYKIVRESEWTDLLMTILSYGNSHILSNFNYRLEMEDRPMNGASRTQTNGSLDLSFHIPQQLDTPAEDL